MLLLAALLLADLKPAFATQSVGTDADDPAIWVSWKNPSESLILGTDKTEAPGGGLVVFNLRGKIVHRVGDLDRPNNVDVEGNLAVVTERKTERLRIFRINPTPPILTDVSGSTQVFVGEKGEDAAPMGVGVYRRPKDGALFAIVTPKAGPKKNHLAQYRIVENPKTKRYDLKLVRRFGNYSGVKETESVFVDDALGFVYYSDEKVGTRKYHADPDARGAGRELGFFNRTGVQGDHEGIAAWGDYLICTDQRKNNSVYRVFQRRGKNAFVGEFRGGADETDGIDATAANLGPKFPKGIFIAMNSGPKNFLVFDGRDVAKAIKK
jgi:3-phytase